MGVIRGPKYPGIEDGLVFCFDPKNRDCWKGGAIDELGNIKNLKGLDTSFSGSLVNGEGDEWSGAITSEGYVSLDGTDDKIRLSPQNSTINGPFQFTNEFSISIWVRCTKAGQTYITGQNPFCMTGGTGSQGWKIYFHYYSYFYVYDTSNAGQYGKYTHYPQPGPTGYPTLNTWINLVGVKGDNADSNNVKIYQDGVVGDTIGTATGIGYDNGIYPTAALPNSAAIGSMYATGLNAGENVNNQNPWSGDIGNVMIWNRALSDAEVLTNYNRLKGRFGL